MATPPTGNPEGRPSAYRPEYCQQIIEAGMEGKSKVEMAAMFLVTRNTLDNWAGEHPEFLKAIESALELSQAWWEGIGRNHITEQYGEGAAGSKVNANLYSRSMAARFPKDWREKTEQTIQGANGGPVSIELSTLSDEQLAARLAALNGGK
jgi:hypothetical protein